MTGRELAVKNLRNTATALLKVVDPDAYQTYREMKYGEEENPDLDTRRDAYAFAFECLLLNGYSMPGL